MSSPFTTGTIRFLRALKRHNDREWFRERKDRYEAAVRQPMIALLDRLAVDSRRSHQSFIAEPKVSLYRICRDTRFSADSAQLRSVRSHITDNHRRLHRVVTGASFRDLTAAR